PRSVMPSRLHRHLMRPALKPHFGILPQKLSRNRHHFLRRRRDLQMGKNLPRNPLIHEYSSVLRVILEFDDVGMAIVGFQQVRLRPAPPPTDELARAYRHAACWRIAATIEERITCLKKRNPRLRPTTKRVATKSRSNS